jgi:hypothetical protein
LRAAGRGVRHAVEPLDSEPLTVETGQLVWWGKMSVSTKIAVRNFWTACPLSEERRVTAGRFASLTLPYGRTEVNVRNVLPEGFGTKKNGLASAPTASS